MADPHTRHLVEELGHRSPELAEAFESALAGHLAGASNIVRARWASMGLRLSGNGWKSMQIAIQFLRDGERLAAATPLDHIESLVELLCRIEPELAARCLDTAPDVFSQLDPSVHESFLSLGQTVAARAQAELWAFFDTGPGLFSEIAATGHTELIVDLIRTGDPSPLSALQRVAGSVRQVPVAQHGLLHTTLSRIAARDQAAAIAFLETASQVFPIMSDDNAMRWVEEGLTLGATERHAWFAIESNAARRRWTALSGYIDFQLEANLLQLFGQALGGEQVHVCIEPSADEKAHPSLDQWSVFVPPAVHYFDNRSDNLDVYRANIAHQVMRRQRGATPVMNGLQNRALAMSLFRIIDDPRVDRIVRTEYPGLTGALDKARQFELSRRPAADRLPLRAAFVENLVHASLDSLATTAWPEPLHDIMATAIGVLRMATTDDHGHDQIAAVLHWLYELARAIPNVANRRCPKPWVPVNAIDTLESLPPVPEIPASLRGLAEEPFDNIAPPRCREQPDFVLVPTGIEEGEGTGDAIDITVAGVDDEASATEGSVVPDDSPEMPPEGTRWYWYDEWDYVAGNYHKEWARVVEQAAPGDDATRYDDTLSRHSGLVFNIRRQFEMMRPDDHRLVHKLYDGDEIDLEDAIRFVTERKAGSGPTPRFYTRRERQERNVAVAFLLDVSHSTGDAIDDDRRIIDVERDAAVLVIEALQSIGDTYGVFGFSGYGRHNVTFRVIKDFTEPFSAEVKARVGSIEPMRSTRMGAAIRHTHARLDAQDAAQKLLILVSDGRPQDQGYGQAAETFDYAVHDTHQALIEARHAGITAFVLTVDASGQDYLQDLCGDLPYEIVADIDALPARLPAVYRHLTA